MASTLAGSAATPLAEKMNPRNETSVEMRFFWGGHNRGNLYVTKWLFRFIALRKLARVLVIFQVIFRRGFYQVSMNVHVQEQWTVAEFPHVYSGLRICFLSMLRSEQMPAPGWRDPPSSSSRNFTKPANSRKPLPIPHLYLRLPPLLSLSTQSLTPSPLNPDSSLGTFNPVLCKRNSVCPPWFPRRCQFPSWRCRRHDVESADAAPARHPRSRLSVSRLPAAISPVTSPIGFSAVSLPRLLGFSPKASLGPQTPLLALLVQRHLSLPTLPQRATPGAASPCLTEINHGSPSSRERGLPIGLLETRLDCVSPSPNTANSHAGVKTPRTFFRGGADSQRTWTRLAPGPQGPRPQVRKTTPIRRDRGLLLFDDGSRSCFMVQRSPRPAADSRRDRLQLAHQRLGHPPFSTLQRLFPSLCMGLDIKTVVCEAC
ncbi:uncharacterized protein LOC144710897 [Wolffia australiana]